MALIARFVSIHTKKVAVSKLLTPIVSHSSIESNSHEYHTFNCTAAHNHKHAERDSNILGGADGGRRIYQVVARPVLISTASQAVRQFCWQSSNCKKSEISVSATQQFRPFASETKTTKRKMVNILFIQCLNF